MLRKPALSVAVFGPAALIIGACGSTAHHHYSAERFKACLATQGVDVMLTRDAGSHSTAALVSRPSFAEWVYFFRTPEAATTERAKLNSSPARTQRVLSRLFRTQRSNVLIFAPARKDWFSPIGRCLQRTRV